MRPRAATAVVLCVGLFVGACTSAAGSEPEDEPTTTSSDATVEILDDPTTASTSTVDTTTAALASVGRDVVIRERPDGLGEQEATIFEPEVPTSSTAVVVLLHGAGSGADRDWFTLLAQTITELGSSLSTPIGLRPRPTPRSPPPTACALWPTLRRSASRTVSTGHVSSSSGTPEVVKSECSQPSLLRHLRSGAILRHKQASGRMSASPATLRQPPREGTSTGSSKMIPKPAL